jgi:maleylpyruvate isomerase
MTRTLADTRRWVDTGTKLVDDAIAGLSSEAVREPSGLPGWTRAHLVAHINANADALANLIRWAATGVETRMYASPEERDEGIEKGGLLPAEDLLAWFACSVTTLNRGMDILGPQQWSAQVVTAQGRKVSATEIPWLRARELMVHAVDLAVGLNFGDLPVDFLQALVEDIVAKRDLAHLPVGPVPEVAAWLAGRPHSLTDAPPLGPWL